VFSLSGGYDEAIFSRILVLSLTHPCPKTDIHRFGTSPLKRGRFVFPVSGGKNVSGWEGGDGPKCSMGAIHELNDNFWSLPFFLSELPKESGQAGFYGLTDHPVYIVCVYSDVKELARY
jgi:hypothetical protein